MVNAQKQSGIVYSEHDGITKAKAMWDAFVKGDKDTYLSYFADSVWHGQNGSMKRKAKVELLGGFTWWKNEFKNLSIVDDTPAFPDAIQYKKGDLFVQDWVRISATHEKSGINLDWPVHNLYHFDKSGKIDGLHQYFNNDIFTEINNSLKTIENGTDYINHPYIVTVRKLVNAYCNEDIDAMLQYYAKNADFYDISNKFGVVVPLEEKMKFNKADFADLSNIKLQQFGYPDCIYYAKDDVYTVYSWWSLSFTNNKGKKYSQIPVMLSHTFNKEGKITSETVFRSINHLE
jgi:hypothetical protein